MKKGCWLASADAEDQTDRADDVATLVAYLIVSWRETFAENLKAQSKRQEDNSRRRLLIASASPAVQDYLCSGRFALWQLLSHSIGASINKKKKGEEGWLSEELLLFRLPYYANT